MRSYLWVSGILFALMAVSHLYLTYEHMARPGGNLANGAAPACVLVISGALAVWAFRLVRRLGPGH